MEITVRKKESEKTKSTIADVKPGYVFKIMRGPIALKLGAGDVVLLKFTNGGDWFGVWDERSWKDSSVKILGRLSEIIVEEE